MRTCFALLAVVGAVSAQGLGPRATPAEYQTQAASGKFTIAAEFRGHAVPVAQGSPLTSEDYIVVEAGLYGPPESRLVLSLTDFSLRVNGKKQGLESLPSGMVVGSLKDPDWEPPTPPSSKGGKTSINGGGGGGGGDSKDPPAPVKIPIEVQRSMAQRTQKAAMPEGDRPLPQAGLLFFKYGGKTKGIRSLELVYDGPAGRATLKLEP